MSNVTVETELVQNRGTAYLVALMPSKTNPDHKYRTDVTNGRCSCPAWKFSKIGADGLRPACKHLKALGFVSLSAPAKVVTPHVEAHKKEGPAWFHYKADSE